jgi:lipopolysaccharide transport system ATP-binding protein
MSRPIIEVRNLSKRYRLGAIGATSFREEFGRLLDRIRAKPHPDSREFWPLRNVSFDIKAGEVVGVIGRNGAGKSTLLKILSRITEPTEGSAILRGRVASLLEVGTGFHPELTGRENTFLNGAILGMSRAEVRKKFDEIVAFAEIDRFIDTPVKRYSSGMYVRLAFAVAAHLEPEILIIDEVLAVGDAEFQKKCLGKMDEVSRQDGRTVLFVSHNMAAVKQLTSQCIHLVGGQVADVGPTHKVLDHYARAAESQRHESRGHHASILETHLTDAHGHRVTGHHGERVLLVEALVETSGHADSSVECSLTDLAGAKLGVYSPGLFAGWRLPAQAGRYRLQLSLALPPLATGTYGLDISTTIGGAHQDHYLTNAIIFETSSVMNFPAQWELRKEYSMGYFILDSGVPAILPEVRPT